MNRMTKLSVVLLVAIFCLNCVGDSWAAEADWKLAIQAWSFRKFTFFEAVDKTASLGLKYIEGYPGQKFSLENPEAVFRHDMSAELKQQAKEKLSAAGVKLINYGVVNLKNDEAQCREVFDFAREMGIETIVAEPPTDALDLVEKLCKEYNIRLAIHNHPKPSFYWNVDTVLSAINGRSSLMGACADTGHWVRSGLDPVECLRKLEGRVVSLHFKDLNEFGTRQAHDVVWGTGKGKVRGMLEELKRQNFKGVFSIEYEHNWDNSYNEIKDSVAYFNRCTKELFGGSSLDIQQLEEVLDKVAKYDYGRNREALSELSDIIRGSYDSPRNLKSIEKRFLEFLRSDATVASKQFICRQLSVIGTAEAVDTLSAMLADAATTDMALYALEQIPGEQVDEAIGKALTRTTGRAKAGIINTLGVRKVEKSVPVLSEMVYSDNAMIASSAAAALGRIANDQALAALSDAKDKTKGAVREQVLDAYLAAADTMGKRGLAIYKELSADSLPLPIRNAALRRIVALTGDKAGDTVLALLAEPAMESTAITLAKEMPSVRTIRAMTEKMSDLSSPGKVQLLVALADREVKAAQPEVIKAVSSDDETVRIAALTALKDLGDDSSVALLAKTAATAKAGEQEAARSSLYKLRGRGIDRTIIRSIAAAETAVKVELIAVAGERNIKAAAKTLLAAATDSDGKVRLESIKVLKVVAGKKDLAALLGLLIDQEKDSDRKELERTIATVANKLDETDGRSEAVLEALGQEYKKQTPATKASLMSILSKIGDDSSVAMVVAAMKDSEASVRDAAVRALADWPTAAPAEELLKIVKTTDNNVHLILALRGYVRQLGLESGRSAEETLERYKQAMALAPNIAEKRMVFAGIAKLRNVAALNMAQEYLADKELGQEAQVALLKIANTTRRTAPEKTKAALEKLLGLDSVSEASRQQAGRLLARIK